MTFEELLNCSVQELEQMTDIQLLDYLSPCLKNCPPIDIEVVKVKEAAERLTKDKIKEAKKLEGKNEKQLQKLAEKDPLGLIEILNQKMKAINNISK